MATINTYNKTKIDDELAKKVPQYATLPTASATYAGQIALFTGATTADYKHGCFYECINNSGTYVWVEAVVIDPSAIVDGTTTDVNATSKIEVKDGGVSTDKLANSAVTEGKIADEAVSFGKLASGAVATSIAESPSASKVATESAVSTFVGKLSTLTTTVKTSIVNAINELVSDKQDTITGGATSITSSNLTASRALVSNSSGKVGVSAVTSTELGYMDGVTSNVQTQLNAKLPLAGGTMTGAIVSKTAIFIKRDVDDNYLDITGGSGWEKGASMHLLGKDYDNGCFKLFASNGTNTLGFVGYPNGDLWWNSKLIHKGNDGIWSSLASNTIMYCRKAQIVFVEATDFTIPASSTKGIVTVATLPEGYRPSIECRGIVFSEHGKTPLTMAWVNTNGEIKTYGNTSALTSGTRMSLAFPIA